MGDRSNVACFNGEKALQVPTLSTEPTLIMSNGIPIPQLAFGMYKIPATDEGETIVGHAIKAGYRHFDSASSYENESTLGRALKKSGIPRENFFICSKVWKDPQIHGRQAVRKSVEESLAALDNRDDGYLDLFLMHWPVPGYHVETYKELELLHQEGKIRSLGISNYLPEVNLYLLYLSL
jgi:diketogulonate reductase-like aldo/keto reductase